MVKYGDDISVRVIKEQLSMRGQTIDNVSKFAFELKRPLFHIVSLHGLSATLNLFCHGCITKRSIKCVLRKNNQHWEEPTLG